MTNKTIYTVGGTVQAGSGFYIHRKADDELLSYCRKNEFAFILSSRQVGKSSLMVRTSQQLEKEGIRSVVIDLSSFGVMISADEWYLGILNEVATTLNLQTDIFAWWSERSALGSAQRLTMFFRDVMLKEVSEPVVLFFDEIDSTLSIQFSDDFFAALRSIYNARSTNLEFKRLSFVLIGVATPSDLIADSARTPFNVGYRVDLTDFTFEEALPLAANLGEQTLRWILDWTGGHPYLTQRLCEALSKDPKEHTEESVADAVKNIFEGEQGKQDNNLQFVRDMLTKRAPDIQRVMRTYKDVRSGQKVPDDERSIPKSHLKISGIVRRKEDDLRTRNRIYEKNFDLKWIKENTPSTTTRKVIGASAFIVIIAMLISGYFVWQDLNRTPEERAVQYESEFQNAQLPVDRVKGLAGLFKLNDTQFDSRALKLFYSLQPDQQIELFSLDVSSTEKEDQVLVIQSVYQSLVFDLQSDAQVDELLKSMYNVLAAEKNPIEENKILKDEIGYWLEGRSLTKKFDYPSAKSQLMNAVRENPNNPALYYEMARIYIQMGKTSEYNYALALDQLESMLQIDSSRGDFAKFLIENNNALTEYWNNEKDSGGYPLLASLTAPPAIGVDISFYANDPSTPEGVDFEKMSESAAFVFIRAGQNLFVDQDFNSNWHEAKLAGIPRGSYWFYDSRADPKIQAELWVEQFDGDFGELPMVADFEENYDGTYKGWKNWRVFLERVKELVPGKEIMIYTGYYYWRDNAPTQIDELEYFHQYSLWVVNYSADSPLIPKPWAGNEWLFWQYTEIGEGLLYGVESININLNYFNGNAQALHDRFEIVK